MPFSSALSWRAPASTQTPSEAEASPGIRSVTMRKPFGRVSS